MSQLSTSLQSLFVDSRYANNEVLVSTNDSISSQFNTRRGPEASENNDYNEVTRILNKRYPRGIHSKKYPITIASSVRPEITKNVLMIAETLLETFASNLRQIDNRAADKIKKAFNKSRPYIVILDELIMGNQAILGLYAKGTNKLAVTTYAGYHFKPTLFHEFIHLWHEHAISSSPQYRKDYEKAIKEVSKWCRTGSRQMQFYMCHDSKDEYLTMAAELYYGLREDGQDAYFVNNPESYIDKKRLMRELPTLTKFVQKYYHSVDTAILDSFTPALNKALGTAIAIAFGGLVAQYVLRVIRPPERQRQ